MGIFVRPDTSYSAGTSFTAIKTGSGKEEAAAAPSAPTTTSAAKKAISSCPFLDGGMTCTNIASALGVKETQQTMAFQTSLVEQSCSLQEKLAGMLGGAGGSASLPAGGLFGMELTTQINSANSGADALEAAGEGLLISGGISAAMVGASGMVVGATAKNFRPDQGLDEELKSAESFKEKLVRATPKDDETPAAVLTREDGSPAAAAENEEENAKMDELIAQWKGSPDKDPSFTACRSDASLAQKRLNEKAIARMTKTEHDTVLNNINEKIAQLKSKIELKQSERRTLATQLAAQVGNSASSIAQAKGQEAQATNQGVSQTESAEAQFFDKMVQSQDQQLRTWQQIASTAASAADSTAQQMAFQG